MLDGHACSCVSEELVWPTVSQRVPPCLVHARVPQGGIDGG